MVFLVDKEGVVHSHQNSYVLRPWKLPKNKKETPKNYANIHNKIGSFKQMIDHRSYVLNLSSWENKAWKNSGLDGIRTHDLCDTGAAL